MIRALAIVAVAGFVMSLAFISAAVAVGGPDALARGAWSWAWDRHWDRHWDRDERPGAWRHEAARDAAQRDFPWTGDRLEVSVPAEITYVQQPGVARLTIRGPAEALDRIRVQDGHISAAPGRSWRSGLQITLYAPDVRRFQLNGADRLSISGYRQDTLTLIANGAAEIRASGEAREVELDISGAGEADLGGLKTQGADIEISGAGEATAGPTEWARVRVSGMGHVELLNRPKRLETEISGAGRVRQPDGPAAEVDQDEDAARGPARPT